MSAGEFLASVLPDRNARLIATFAGFVVVQFLFARIYLSLYRRRRSNFSFNSEILRGQVTQIETRAANRSLGIEVLQEALQQLEMGAIPAEVKYGSQLTLPSGRRAKITLLGGPPAGGPNGCFLELFDADGEMLFETRKFDPPGASFLSAYSNSAHWLKSDKEWKVAVTNALANAVIQRDKEQPRLASLATDEPDAWSFWDFFYFSTVIQTTVGLGDILPNSTVVRMVVAVHVLIGYALLIVVLNIAIA